MNDTVKLAQPIIDSMQEHGRFVTVDKAEHGLQSTWIDVGPLCVKVHPEHGYGLYLDGDKAFGSGPDEVFPYDQLDRLLERMRSLLAIAG